MWLLLFFVPKYFSTTSNTPKQRACYTIWHNDHTKIKTLMHGNYTQQVIKNFMKNVRIFRGKNVRKSSWRRIKGPALEFKNVRKRYQESRKSSENVRKNVRNFPNENFGLDLICWHFWIRFVFVIFLNTFSDIFGFGLIVWHSLTWANFLLFLNPNSDIFCLNRIFENFSDIF